MFYLILLSLLLSIITSLITKSFEYVIVLFCLLIIQKGLTILFIFDDGSLEAIPLNSWSF